MWSSARQQEQQEQQQQIQPRFITGSSLSYLGESSQRRSPAVASGRRGGNGDASPRFVPAAGGPPCWDAQSAPALARVRGLAESRRVGLLPAPRDWRHHQHRFQRQRNINDASGEHVPTFALGMPGISETVHSRQRPNLSMQGSAPTGSAHTTAPQGVRGLRGIRRDVGGEGGAGVTHSFRQIHARTLRDIQRHASAGTVRRLIAEERVSNQHEREQPFPGRRISALTEQASPSSSVSPTRPSIVGLGRRSGTMLRNHSLRAGDRWPSGEIIRGSRGHAQDPARDRQARPSPSLSTVSDTVRDRRRRIALSRSYQLSPNPATERRRIGISQRRISRLRGESTRSRSQDRDGDNDEGDGNNNNDDDEEETVLGHDEGLLEELQIALAMSASLAESAERAADEAVPEVSGNGAPNSIAVERPRMQRHSGRQHNNADRLEGINANVLLLLTDLIAALSPLSSIDTRVDDQGRAHEAQYENLVDLEDVRVVASDADIRSLKIECVTKGHEQEGSSCSICLSEFAIGDSIVQLPVCKHFFHYSCISRWLTDYKNTCPSCRSSVFEFRNRR